MPTDRRLREVQNVRQLPMPIDPFRDQDCEVGPLCTYNPFAPSTYINYTFPGVSHYYFLYIRGPDYIYTSPIFVKS